MSIRNEVEYKVFEDIKNVALLQELRLGEPSETKVDLDEVVGFLVEWIAGIQNGLFLLADHVDELASG
jgi:hypothetical protein